MSRLSSSKLSFWGARFFVTYAGQILLNDWRQRELTDPFQYCNGIITIKWAFCAPLTFLRHQANQSFGKKRQPVGKKGNVFKKSESESESKRVVHCKWTRFHFLAKP